MQVQDKSASISGRDAALRSTRTLDDMSEAAAMAKVSADIERFGWHCLHVYPRQGEEGVGFSYTIGLTETLDHAEIAIFGLDRDKSHAILCDCVEAIRAGTRYPLDVPVADVLARDIRVQFKRAHTNQLRKYFGTATRHYGSRTFEVSVMFWPNRDGLFPWETSEPSVQREALDVV